MTDVTELLDGTARSVEVTPSAETVEADLRRGRIALARRRRGLAIRLFVAGAVAVALVGAVALDGERAPDSRIVVDQGSGPDRGTPVRLVAYEGEQLDGFIVDEVPEGWYLQGSNAFRLTIAPQGDTTSPDDFVGKLVVKLLSSSAPQELPKEGDSVKVGDQEGVISHGPPADTLTYEDDAGHFVQIQAWSAPLGWSDEQLISFAEGVQVTSHAQPGVG
jgi:hypothetical protein